MHGKTNVKKWKTFEKKIIQEPYQVTETYIDYETYTYYETVTTPVYATGSVSVYGGASSYSVLYTIRNGTNTEVKYGHGSYNLNTLAPGQQVKFNDTNTDFIFYIGDREIGRTYNASNTVYVNVPANTIKIGETTTQVPRQGTRPVTKTRTVTKYRDKEIIEETWHPWWVKKKG